MNNPCSLRVILFVFICGANGLLCLILWGFSKRTAIFSVQLVKFWVISICGIYRTKKKRKDNFYNKICLLSIDVSAFCFDSTWKMGSISICKRYQIGAMNVNSLWRCLWFWAISDNPVKILWELLFNNFFFIFYSSKLDLLHRGQ